jgi:putative cell wall-binding protein
MKRNRKSAAACLIALSVALIATAALASAQNGNTVILVSDNEADSAVAEAIMNVRNIEIVTTPWGVYSEDVVDQIDDLDPSTIFVIGGPSAVLSEYETSLESYRVIRISGEDRYATAAATLRHFRENFRGKGVVVAYGYDSKGIRKALEKAKGLGGIVLFVKPDDVPDEVIDALEDSGVEEVEGVDSPNMDGEKIRKKLARTRARFKFAKMNATDKESRASEQIEDAKDAIDDAEEEIGDCETGTAIHLLEKAKMHVENAEGAENPGRAYGQAVSAEHIARNAERFAKKHLCLGRTGPDGSTTTTTSSTTTTTESTTTTEPTTTEPTTTTTTESTTTTEPTTTTTTESTTTTEPTTTTTTSTTTTTIAL